MPLDQVLLIRQENKITIGTPFVDKAIVQAKVLEQTRDKKIVVFKKKRRKGYKKKQGHRQYKTTLLIEKILEALVEASKTNNGKKTKTAKKQTLITIASPKEQAAKQTSKNLEAKKSAGLKSKE